jgi:DNA-binding MltR family transcriptional regulator
MHWVVTSTSPEDMAVLDEVNRGASDRALGIIAASLVEIHLTKLIKQAFIPEIKTGSKETVQDRMFQSSGPLGAFSTKIRMAYMMGMISEEFFKNLEIMREIRNRFAHHTEMGSFEIEEISSRRFNFTLVDKYVTDEDAGLHGHPSALFNYMKPGAAALLKEPKGRYILSTLIFSMGIQHASVNPKPYTPAF